MTIYIVFSYRLYRLNTIDNGQLTLPLGPRGPEKKFSCYEKFHLAGAGIEPSLHETHDRRVMPLITHPQSPARATFMICKVFLSYDFIALGNITGKNSTFVCNYIQFSDEALELSIARTIKKLYGF